MSQSHPESVARTWLWILVMVGIIVGQSLLAFYVVSDRGQPDWDYRAVKDVPAQSPDAVYQKLPHAQHVRGQQGE